jgi:hypothetical protein
VSLPSKDRRAEGISLPERLKLASFCDIDGASEQFAEKVIGENSRTVLFQERVERR